MRVDLVVRLAHENELWFVELGGAGASVRKSLSSKLKGSTNGILVPNSSTGSNSNSIESTGFIMQLCLDDVSLGLSKTSFGALVGRRIRSAAYQTVSRTQGRGSGDIYFSNMAPLFHNGAMGGGLKKSKKKPARAETLRAGTGDSAC